jgi:hypothetical protein
METECNQKPFEFHGLGRREVVAHFDGGSISSDAGGVLLREVERASCPSASATTVMRS